MRGVVVVVVQERQQQARRPPSHLQRGRAAQWVEVGVVHVQPQHQLC
jgi:hypothetical protein